MATIGKGLTGTFSGELEERDNSLPDPAVCMSDTEYALPPPPQP